jgi:very-short-patch-repair endonuclease
MDLFVKTVESLLNVKVETEYRFDKVRKWRFDYCIIDHKIAVEVEGGAYTQGRHTRGKGFIGDMEKYNAATCHGWRILRVIPVDLMSAKTLQMIETLLK